MNGSKKVSKIRVEFFHKSKNRFFNKKLTQFRPFDAYLRFTNIGDSASSEFTVKNFKISSKSAGGATASSKEYIISQLNPQMSCEIKIDSFKPSISGLSWVEVKLIPKNAQENEIQTYQYDDFHKIDDPVTTEDGKEKLNEWGHFIFFISKIENLQHQNNIYVLILTCLTAIHGIFGLKEFIAYPLKFIADAFEKIALFLRAYAG